MKSASPKATELTRSRLNTNSPVVPSPRHKSEDLSIYKVLGAIGKVLLVLDTRNNESYVFKVRILQTSSKDMYIYIYSQISCFDRYCLSHVRIVCEKELSQPTYLSWSDYIDITALTMLFAY